ncbi:MAG: hypothetical protein HUU20_09250 [Pirellulales bacterium]|nr:hypothetical protein [Pirellulales bacterium]
MQFPRPLLPLILLASLLPAACAEEKPAAGWRGELVAPAAEFSQMPFWFWNDELDNAEIARQMAEFRRQGVFGFVIHGRIGLPQEIPYMGDRWLDHVRFAVDEAARTGMHVCLYDEGMYPSGSAHGAVVRSNSAFAAKGLSARSQEIDGPAKLRIENPVEGSLVAAVAARRNGDAVDLDGALVTDKPGEEMSLPEGQWRVVTFSCVSSGGRIRGVHFGEDDGQPGAPPAADLLDPDSVRAFLRFAYEPYYEKLKDHFGKTVFAVFTDEPSELGRGAKRGLQPWTGSLADDFRRRRGYSLLPLLPALFMEAGPRTERVRQDFKLTLAERLDETYYQQLSQWCADHGVELTGHPSGSDEIRPLRLFQLPGQDMVWRWVLPGQPTMLEGANSTVAKCSSSVARHDARRRNANEIYGAYGWHLTMDEMKGLADWLMVRGVNLLYPHAFYYSVREQRAYERPPDLGMHNAWWPCYRQFADYTSRLCGLLTDSRQVCDVAVLSVANHLPWRAARWLFQNQVDFNYLEDWRLLEQSKLEGATMQVGAMTYRLVIVDHDEPLAAPVAASLDAFKKAGGLVRYCRSEPTAELVSGLHRDLAVEPPSPDLRYAHVQKYGMDFYLLTNEGEGPIDTAVTFRVRGKAEWFDPWTAEFHPAMAASEGQDGAIRVRLRRRESLVLSIDPTQPPEKATPQPRTPSLEAPIDGPWKLADASGRQLARALDDWRVAPELTEFAGTLRYETAFDAATKPGKRYELDLGGVGDWTVVWLNGRKVGVRFWAPYEFDVTESIRDGRNELRVEVTNSWANKHAPKDARASGLFGPVVLRGR